MLAYLRLKSCFELCNCFMISNLGIASFSKFLCLIIFTITGRSRNGKNITRMERLLTYLYHIRCNVFYYQAGTNHGMSQGSICNSIKMVNNAIYKIRHLYLKVPSEQEAKQEAAMFSEFSGLPPIVWGSLDGTHIKIKAPKDEESEMFRNRHHYLSLNVMVVVGCSGKFYFISAGNPGRKHDSRIAHESKLFKKLLDKSFIPFKDSHGNVAILIADSAYQSRLKIMAVPIPIPETKKCAIKKRFNKKFKKARGKVECFIGIVKKRWPILDSCLRFPNVKDSG